MSSRRLSSAHPVVDRVREIATRERSPRCRSTWNGTNSTRPSPKRSSTSSTDSSPTPNGRPSSDPSKSRDSTLVPTHPTSSSLTCATSTVTFSKTIRRMLNLSRTTASRRQRAQRRWQRRTKMGSSGCREGQHDADWPRTRWRTTISRHTCGTDVGPRWTSLPRRRRSTRARRGTCGAPSCPCRGTGACQAWAIPGPSSPRDRRLGCSTSRRPPRAALCTNQRHPWPSAIRRRAMRRPHRTHHRQTCSRHDQISSCTSI